MIHVFFVPGMFGSMIEMSLRGLTDIDDGVEPLIAENGSCHVYTKDFHVTDIDQFCSICTDRDVKITTPIYPWNTKHLDQILPIFAEKFESWHQDSKILIYAPNQKWAEINMLFQYYKISLGLGRGLEIFGGNTNTHNIQNWNNNYTHWSQMQSWEYREWLSLFYPVWIQEWVVSPKLVTTDFLVISNKEILESMSATLHKIFNHCRATVIKPIMDFCQNYVSKQKYVLQEYSLIETIVEYTINRRALTWQPISLVGEAILQQKFRQQGYEWYCDGLDLLPTNTRDFQNIIFLDSKGKQ